MQQFSQFFSILLALAPLLASGQTTLITRTVEVTRVSTLLSSTATDTAKTSDVAAAATSQVPLDQQNPVDTTPIDPDAAGASGHDTGAFSISKGGIIAIIICVTIVAVLGTSILVLWYIAKKRQWEVRKSLKRVSRRLTGRLDDSKSKRQSRRTAVRVASPPAPKDRRQNTDIEKGRADEHQGQSKAKTTTKITSTFSVDSPTAKTWKQKLFDSNSKRDRT